MILKGTLPMLLLLCTIIMQIECQAPSVLFVYPDPHSPTGFQIIENQDFLPKAPYQNLQGVTSRQSNYNPQQQPTRRELDEATTPNTFRPPTRNPNPNYSYANLENNQKPQQQPTQQFSGQPQQTEKLPSQRPSVLQNILNQISKRPSNNNNNNNQETSFPTDNRRVSPQQQQQPTNQNSGVNPSYNIDNSNYNERNPNQGVSNPRPPSPQRPSQPSGENYNTNGNFQPSYNPGQNQQNVPSHVGLSFNPNIQNFNQRPPSPRPESNEQNGNINAPNFNHRPTGLRPESNEQQINNRRPPNRPIYISNEESNKPDHKPFVNFAWNLFKATNLPQNPNLVMCPLSPQLLLTYLIKGSDGETQSQLRRSTELDSPKYLQNVINGMLNEGSNRELQFATAFFVANNIKLNPLFANDAIEVIQTDFRNPQRFSSQYNSWASGKTKNQLPAVRFTPDPLSKMIMSSAVYFKGGWIYKFNPAPNGDFNTPAGRKSVPMMTLKKKLPYGTIGDMAEWISIPYNSTDSMVVILPKQQISLDGFIQNIDKSQINRIVDSIGTSDQYANTNLTMPKFKIETSASLVKPLQQMGITKAFQENAELTKLTATGEPMHLSNAVQQASLEVNEEGSIATSLTSFSVVALSYSPPVPDVEFLVNRPFIAMIVDRSRNIPYFVCKVSNP